MSYPGYDEDSARLLGPPCADRGAVKTMLSLLRGIEWSYDIPGKRTGRIQHPEPSPGFFQEIAFQEIATEKEPAT